MSTPPLNFGGTDLKTLFKEGLYVAVGAGSTALISWVGSLQPSSGQGIFFAALLTMVASLAHKYTTDTRSS